MIAYKGAYALISKIASTILPAILLSAVLTGQEMKPVREELSEWSRQWLDEVVPYIITRAEKEVFLSLPNEAARGQFIESFWKRRDPDPATPVNEYKEEYYRRIGVANRLFGTSGIAGWRTERGRFFILLGPPHEVQRDFNVADARGFNTVTKETWQYWGLPNPKLPYNVELAFVDRTGSGDYVLERDFQSEEGVKSGDMRNLTFQFDAMEILAEAQKNPFENLDKIKTVITTQVTYDLIPFEFRTYTFKREGGQPHIIVVIDIPYTSVAPKPVDGMDRYSLNIVAQVSNSLGAVVAQKSREVSFSVDPGRKESLKNDQVQVQTSLSLEPGTYGIHFVVWDNHSGKAGTRHAMLNVPGFANGEPTMSDVLLSAARAEGAAATGSRVFRNGEEMEAAVEVYSLALDETTGLNSFLANFEFLRDSQTVLKAPMLEPKPSAQKDVRIRNAFRLKGFIPGEYTLRITVVDKRAGRTLSRDAIFAVAD